MYFYAYFVGEELRLTYREKPVFKLANWCFVYYGTSKIFCPTSSLGHFIFHMEPYIIEETFKNIPDHSLFFIAYQFSHCSSNILQTWDDKYFPNTNSQVSGGLARWNPHVGNRHHIKLIWERYYPCRLWYGRNKGQYILEVTRTCLISVLQPPFWKDVCATLMWFRRPHQKCLEVLRHFIFCEVNLHKRMLKEIWRGVRDRGEIQFLGSPRQTR